MDRDYFKQLWRAAELIHTQASQWQLANGRVALPTDNWCEFSQLQRRRQRAIQSGWNRAARSLLAESVTTANALRLEFDELCRQLRQQPLAPPSMAEIYRDLVSLRQEFEDVMVDFEEQELCVKTAPIIFNHLDLGDFEIRLKWTRINEPCSYRVVALNPSPARSNSDVTHPHISNEQLCEGDGRAAVRAALAGLRLSDFFLLVGRLLATYAQGRAYVELDEWRGEPCHGCGCGVDSDDRSYCQRCDETFCNDCIESCSFCDESHCSDCLEVCAHCDLRLCSSCLDACSVCGTNLCSDCLTQERCAECNATDDQNIESAQTADDRATATAANAAVQPDCLGQASLPA
jgi:hypothetical protein